MDFTTMSMDHTDDHTGHDHTDHGHGDGGHGDGGHGGHMMMVDIYYIFALIYIS